MKQGSFLLELFCFVGFILDCRRQLLREDKLPTINYPLKKVDRAQRNVGIRAGTVLKNSGSGNSRVINYGLGY